MASDASPRMMPAPPPAPFHPFRTLPGRLLLLSGVSLIVLWLISQAVTLPPLIETFRKVASFAVRVSILWLAVLIVVRFRQQFLWRVRSKLILSYVFLGFVPLVLIVVFASVGAVILHGITAVHLFNGGLEDLQAEVHQVAAMTAAEIGAVPIQSAVVINRQYMRLGDKYPRLSLAVVPVTPQPATASPLAEAGAWHHLKPPTSVPIWARERDFVGLLAMVFDGPNGAPGKRLLVRASVPLASGTHVVIVDLPVDVGIVERLDQQTGAHLRGIVINENADPREAGQPLKGLAPAVPDADDEDLNAAGFTILRRTVMFKDFTDWDTSISGRVSLSLDAPVGGLVKLLSEAQGAKLQGQVFFAVLVALGVLLLIVQGVALFFGAGLGRQITAAVHELSVGTERVQQGDFTHRIRIDSNDQLGELCESHNRMSGSIEHLLHVQREKQRLDDELRIARDIQQSLLPETPPAFDGLTIADLCVPAREVGGDYYDFFQLGPRQLGVLVADVSGKGTSAALYMAELKGLMLALSQLERSPRALLTRVNRLLADHLDNRSFITA
ncbi:MAG TPA: SpoIIE family protein phosphatase, partial [Vicinamibacterales bacterium]|nr:SpoIIE family protein phosphatase [Vicinamibacterales bacterium]